MRTMLPGPWLVVLLVASIVLIVLANIRLHIHIFLVLLLAGYLMGIMAGMDPVRTIETITSGFGDTLRSIGIVITLGCVVSLFLERSGAVYVMADAVLRLVGEARAVLAVSLMGFVVSIPVFCDSGFVILSPLAKALAKRLKYSATVFGIALSTGLYATHCLVPPTPGPVACAGLLGADLGLVILLGLICTVPAMLAGLWYATRIAKRYYVEPEVELSYEETRERFKTLPSTTRAFLPIVVPILLICAGSIAGATLDEGVLLTTFRFVGDPVTALLAGLGFAFALVPRNREASLGWVEEGLTMAASIVFITGAGGAFGTVLRETGTGAYLGDVLSGYRLWLLLPFLISALLKTAQGSSTVALVTTPTIVGPILPSLGLASPVGLALTVLAIGAGAMVVSHVNDSYFWVVTKLSGIEDVGVGYRTQTLATLIEGAAAMIAVLVLGAILL